ncbi:hypothetical protein A2U01_0033793, partial [Trifolium medium]|nr:hypothetical protein [Trifolium medium]
FPEECRNILDFILEASECHNRPEYEACEFFSEFIRRPRGHSSFTEVWVEFVKEKDLKIQEGASTKSVTTQIELDPLGNKGEDSEVDKVVETPRSEEGIHKEDEEPSQTKETDLERFMETLKKLEASSLEDKQQPDDYIFVTEECSAILTKKPQQKRDDPRSLPIPCSIGEVTIEGALCDLDSNINLMTFSLASRLVANIGELKTTPKTLILADRSEICP